jgi:DNA polymerase-3 subunit beta
MNKSVTFEMITATLRKAIANVMSVKDIDTIPEFASVNIESDGKKLFLRKNNGQQAAQDIIDIEGANIGVFNIIVKSVNINNLVSKLPADEMKLVVNNNNLEIVQIYNGKALKYELAIHSEHNFGKLQIDHGTSMEVTDLGTIMRTVRPACSSEHDKAVLMGIHFKNVNGTLEIVATDGRRLNMYQIVNDVADFTATIPIDSINGLSKFMNCILDVSEKSVSVRNGSFTYSTKLIEGKYPNYSQIIPSKEDQVIVIEETQLLKDGIKRVVNFDDFASDSSVKVTCKGNNLAIDSNTSENSGHEEINIESDHDYTVNLNARFLEDALPSNNTVKLFHGDPVEPIKLVSDNFVSVIMPMRK